MIVCSLWAIVRTVQSLNFVRIVCCISSSVLKQRTALIFYGYRRMSSNLDLFLIHSSLIAVVCDSKLAKDTLVNPAVKTVEPVKRKMARHNY